MADNGNNQNDTLDLGFDTDDLSGLPGGKGTDNNEGGSNPPDNKQQTPDPKKVENQTTTDVDNQDGKNNQQDDGNNEPVVVEIDGVDHKLDENGNAVDEAGLVVKTAEEIAAAVEAQKGDEPSEETTTAIDDFIKLTGVQPVDEEGKPKVYEDSVPGLLEAAKDTAILEARKAFRGLLEAKPHVKKYLEYLERGGDAKEYHKQVASSWKEVKLDKKNTDMLTNAVVAQLMKAGLKEDKARLTAKMYADTNQLEEMGTEAYQQLVANEDAREESEKQAYQARIKQQEEANKTYWTDIEKVVKAGKLQNIVIPENEKGAFFKYIGIEVDKNGLSQADIDEQKLTTQQWLELRYLLYKKLDISKLVTQKAGTQRVAGIKARFKSGQGGLGDGQGVNRDQRSSKNGLDDLTLDGVIDGITK